MIFYNIVIGSTVMYKKEYRAYYGKLTQSHRKYALEHDGYKVIGISFVRKGAFIPKNFFKINLTIQNSYGGAEYCGISAVKPIDIF